MKTKAKTAAERMREYRARNRKPAPETRCNVCGADFAQTRSDAVYCSATCRSKARHDRVVLAAEAAREYGLGAASAKVLELSLSDRLLSKGWVHLPANKATRRTMDLKSRIQPLTLRWLIKLVHEWHRYGEFPVDGWREFGAMARWLRAHPEANLRAAERELRQFYKAIYGLTYRLPRRGDGKAHYLPPSVSEHALHVMRSPVRRARQQRSAVSIGDCVAVAIAIVLRIDYVPARAILGSRRTNVIGVEDALLTAGYRVSTEYVDAQRIPLRRAGEVWPKGRHLAFIPNHVAAVIDGRVDDHAGDETAVVSYILHIQD